jgi:predicted transcriptional regulator
MVCWHTVRRTTIKLPDDLDVLLRHEAARRRVTISTVTREAIQEHLAPPGRRRLAGGRAWQSGESGVSERVEEILRREFTR